VSVPWRGIPGIGEPAFDWDFAAGHLPTAVRDALTRATVATAHDTGGNVVTVPSGKLCFDHDANGKCLGLLAERNWDNLFTYSEQLDHAVWTKGGTPAVTITANHGTSPNGETTADRIQVASTSANTLLFSQNKPLSGATAGREFTISGWLKLNSGTATGGYLRFTESGGAMGNELHQSPEFTVTSDWQRFSFTATLTENDRTVLVCRFQMGSTSSEELDWLGWGFDVKESPYLTSYIKSTSSSGSRDADELIDLPINSTSEGTVR